MTDVASCAPSLEAAGMTMRFGAFTALEDVAIKVAAGSFHALMGENGAGKSTLVKCIMGFNRPLAGGILVNGHEVEIKSPKDAARFGIGMVFQHFTLVPSLTAAENLVIARDDVPAVIDWRKERARLGEFVHKMPFDVRLDTKAQDLAAGEKQKLEIVKQLYLGRRLIILDEPTSVLTPGEADDLLGLLRSMTLNGDLTVLMISHKFHEVMKFANEVTVLRKGRVAGAGSMRDLDQRKIAQMMVGDEVIAPLGGRATMPPKSEPLLSVRELRAVDATGLKDIEIVKLSVNSGEIVGIAGVSGNGQKEFFEVLAGQRDSRGGEVFVNGENYHATRAESRKLKVRLIPEEPLRNACAPRMSVAENLALRNFDVGETGGDRFWIDEREMKKHAGALISAFKVKASSMDAPIAALSGGNVQRAVLARELTGEVNLLIVSNPCFGLDFAAVAEIRARIMAARNGGAGVLLFSEDLDEILQLSDRILVMSGGRIVYETPVEVADTHTIGEFMAGHH